MKRLVTSHAIGASMWAAALLAPSPASAAAAVSAGAFRVEPSTLVSLGFEWAIGGDDNRNAAVAVSYRRKGAAAWATGLPLLRIGGEQVRGGRPRHGDDHYYDYVAPPMFAGSILGLEPDTEYEARFVLTDPDGASGTVERVATVRTRAVPRPAEGGQVYHVYPYGHAGPRIEPAFTGLNAAYYRGSDQSDHSIAMPPRVRPGDVILVHAGVYKDDRAAYGGFDPKFAGYGTPFDGTYYLTESGTAERPITIRAAGDGEVIFDGDGNHNLFNLLAASHVHFEGITVRNTQIAFLIGLKDIAGSSGFSLRRSRIVDVGRGVQDEWAGSRDLYIADNVFIGRHDPTKLTGWWPVDAWRDAPGGPSRLDSEYAVKVYGQGHVVAHNYLSGWHDGIDVSTYGTPSDDPERWPVSIDFYRNDISNISDNCIEADGSAHNVRVFENRCFSVATGGLSAQPIFGGPAYFIRNLVYAGAAGGAVKLIDTPAGVLFYQNTLIGQGPLLQTASNLHWRNNLILGDGWNETLFNVSTFTNYSSADHNGFRPNPRAKASFTWDSPPFGTPADYARPLVKRPFATLADYVRATGQDRHSVLVDYDAFVKAGPPDRADRQRLYRPNEFDFRLRGGAAAIDRGTVLPTVTDGFTGRAPDLGAYERGRPVPLYGPRQWPTGTSAADPRGEA